MFCNRLGGQASRPPVPALSTPDAVRPLLEAREVSATPPPDTQSHDEATVHRAHRDRSGGNAFRQFSVPVRRGLYGLEE